MINGQDVQSVCPTIVEVNAISECGTKKRRYFMTWECVRSPALRENSTLILTYRSAPAKNTTSRFRFLLVHTVRSLDVICVQSVGP